MYKVMGTDPRGRAMTFACGTDEQALERAWELARRGFQQVRIADPSGREQSAAAFERSLNLEFE